MFDCRIVSFDDGPGHLQLLGLPVLVAPNEFEGVHIAVENLAEDICRVTGARPPIWKSTAGRPHVNGIIVIGSLERCHLFDDLPNKSHGMQIRGKWEAFETGLYDCPWPFADYMLVITGSDKRGTIYGVYTLSEQIGVSPWYWWADVPIEQRDGVYALPTTTQQGEPSVQYRGIFINDEAPALTDWAHEKFDSVYGSRFYGKVFELLLRMKANFLWPAMWSGFPEPGSSFFTDDPLNQELADRYGVVISTSHHEPMQRGMTEWHVSGKGAWNWEENKTAVKEYFAEGAERSRPFESILTLGMRGSSDGEIEATDPLSVLADIIDTQRNIIQDVYGKKTGVTQVMALYKEVQEYYEAGLEVPEDVTLLFADDNFGNVRRLPNNQERSRNGGIGLYYHLEYVGLPRSYKWINSNSCGKIHQQLRYAFDSGIKKIWIFNVGDIKPLELPLTFAMSLAWNIDCVSSTTIPMFFEAFAAREFGSQHAANISELLLAHDRLSAIRRYEQIEPETFSMVQYKEAEQILARFQRQERKAEAIFQSIPEFYKAAYFQLVWYPIRASQIFVDLQMNLARNKLYGEQRRNTTNVLAQRVLDLFDLDFNLTEEYHNSRWTGNKWNHIMKQPHYGLPKHETWHTPSRNMITGLSFVQLRQDSTRIAGQMGVAVEGHPGVMRGLVNEECCRMQPSRGVRVPGLTLPVLSPYGACSRFFEIFCQGAQCIEWSLSDSSGWLEYSQTSGKLEPNDPEDQRVEITVCWEKVPRDFEGLIHVDVRSRSGDFEQVHLPLSNRRVPKQFSGYVESEGCVSIEVGTTSLNSVQSLNYQRLPYIGRCPAGAIALAPSPTQDIPYLEYAVFLFSKVKVLTITLYFTMALDAVAESPLAYGIGLDESTLCSVPLMETRNKGDLPEGWSKAVQDGAWIRNHQFTVTGSGAHRVRCRLLAPGLLLEKLVLDAGGLRESYLGPTPSSNVQSYEIDSTSRHHL